MGGAPEWEKDFAPLRFKFLDGVDPPEAADAAATIVDEEGWWTLAEAGASSFKAGLELYAAICLH